MGHKLEQNKVVNSRTDFFYYTFRNVLLFSIPLLIVSGLVLSHLSLHSSAEGNTNRVDSVTLNLSVSCTISASELTPHTANLEGGGLHKENIGTTKVGVFCNDNNGYNVYAIGSSNNVDGNTDLVVSTLSSDYNIKTGIYSNGSTISSWGMKLTAGTGTGAGGESVTPPTIVNGYNDYNVVPSVYTLVASRPSGTNMNQDANIDVTGSYFTTTYDIYASSVQPPDTYIGKVKYILIHPNTNAPSTINDLDAAFAIAGKSKSHYDQSGNGPYFSMQDMTSDICNSVTRTGELTTTQLVDIRDNNLYYVTKLADGKCWMTQNLDLAIGSTNVPLTSENTDISTTASGSNIYTNGYTENSGVWTWTPASTAITSNSTVNHNNNSVSNWTSSGTAPASTEAGDAYYYTTNTTSSETKTTLAGCIANGHTEAECKHYHAGDYYNWTAAIASNNSSSISSDYAQASNSICPKGWRLPVASNSDQSVFEFGDLMYTYYHITTVRRGTSIWDKVSYTSDGLNNLRKAPLWFVRSGYISNNALYDSGVGGYYGYYWSSTIRNGANAYNLGIGNDGLSPALDRSRSYGFPVRCVAR